MTPTDDRGAAALAERLCMAQERNDLAHVADTTAAWWREVAERAIGERGRFLPDGSWTRGDVVLATEAELARLRKIEAAARVMLDHHDELVSVPSGEPLNCNEATALRAALESDQ